MVVREAPEQDSYKLDVAALREGMKDAFKDSESHRCSPCYLLAASFCHDLEASSCSAILINDR